MKHGQVAMEYMAIFGISLVILGLLWSYSSTNIEDTRWELQAAYAKSALNKLSELSDLAYIQGPPGQFYVYLTFPDNVKNIYINNNMITFELQWKNGILRNLSSDTTPTIVGNLSTAPGSHKILVKAFQGYVNITEA